jgi:hypothetical protein
MLFYSGNLRTEALPFSEAQDKQPDGLEREFYMAERIEQQNSISAEEVLETEILVNQALIDILISKQIISEEELVAGIRKIRQEQLKLYKDSKKIVSLKR